MGTDNIDRIESRQEIDQGVSEISVEDISVRNFPGFRPMILSVLLIVVAFVIAFVVPLYWGYWADQTGATPVTYLQAGFGLAAVLVGFLHEYMIDRELEASGGER